MRGAALPIALLCVALAFALARSPRQSALIGIAVAVVTAGAAAMFAWPPNWHEGVFLAGWIGVIAMAGSVHLPRGVPVTLALGFGSVTGVLAGAITAYEGRITDLALALPALLLLFPARALADRGWSIVIKVAASWLIAVAILAALLPLAPTPGYVPDHME